MLPTREVVMTLESLVMDEQGRRGVSTSEACPLPLEEQTWMACSSRRFAACTFTDTRLLPIFALCLPLTSWVSSLTCRYELSHFVVK